MAKTELYVYVKACRNCNDLEPDDQQFSHALNCVVNCEFFFFFQEILCEKLLFHRAFTAFI
jgi:hypothetical protein